MVRVARVSAWVVCLSGLAVRPVRAQAAEAPTPAVLRGVVVESGSDQPVACTVTIVDASKKVVTDRESFRGGFRSDGRFERRLPPGRTKIRVTRGPETRAADKEVDLRADEVTEVKFALERLVDLRRRGWFAGDSHVHMLHGERTVPVNFDDVALATRAEDLQYLSLAQAWTIAAPTPENLEAELARRSRPDCLLTWNLEAPKNYYKGDAGRCLGHCWSVGTRGRDERGGDVIQMLQEASAADYESQKPSFASFESHALIHAQGGTVFYTHPLRWWTGPWGGEGGYPKQEKMRVSNMAVELPLDTLVGPTFDGLDVITGAGEYQADQKSFALWALLLNHGYRVAATASSDACFDRPGGAMPGTARVYTFIDGPFSLAAVARAMAQGRTFATTGPLLLASVAGQPPGTAFPADDRVRELAIEAWASGAQSGGLKRVEILRNGKLAQTLTLDGVTTSLRTNLPVRESESCWYAVRLFGTEEQRQRAISGAFFFDRTPWRAPEPVPARVRVRIVDVDSGKPLEATLTEIQYRATRPIMGKTHRVTGGEGRVTIPGTARLRADVAGYESKTLSPFLDNPPLVELITRLEDKDLLNWDTFERVRWLLTEVSLTFALKKSGAVP